MTNALALCLLVTLFCCSNLSSARQIPKECAKGPELWCQSLRQAADCGAVGHCISTVWVSQEEPIRKNDIANKFVTLFSELKDINELINDEYLGLRVKTACRSSPAAAYKVCKQNTAGLQQYLSHVLASKTSAETICRIVGLCNNEKLDAALQKKTEPKKHKEQLLGHAQCTWGPSYWCSNFSTGRECKATHHCVERVWSQMHFPEDTDDICKICTDMVTQARDQLQSNETQEELKEVFEGSCKLIPIKLVQKECIKLADDFVPELVETLASQMNPQAVCSVAGLCNNAKIDLMLEDYNVKLAQRQDCESCQQTVTVVRNKFDSTSYDDFLVGLLQVCRNVGSLSDSCSMLVFKYYENILAAVKKDLIPKSMCHLSGQCNDRFHSHADYTFPIAKQLSEVDDVPCEFCEKLVLHLRDILVANTTEIEFHKIATGLCKQTGQFKDECLALVNEYADQIYSYLVSGLKAHEICAMIGVCGKSEDVPIAPLLPSELAVKAVTMSTELIGTDEANSYATEKLDRVEIGDKQTDVRILSSDPQVPALPIERMFVAAPQGKAACSFCQYFLHYLQVELSDTNTEDAIKSAVQHACEKLPPSINGECKQFVTEYGEAVIALLVQEIDPSSVCPALGLCPQTQAVSRAALGSEKSNCPLCLFAIEQLETIIKNNRSETAIQAALDGLCNHLSAKLRTQCVDFVDTYSKQLVEMLVANLDAQEICVHLKLCSNYGQDPLELTSSSIDKWFQKSQLQADRNNAKGKSLLPKTMLSGHGDIETNEIPDNTVNGRRVKQPQVKTICIMCEFVMKQIDDEIKDKHNQDEIKNIVHGVCKRMPKSIRADCDQFVEKYADLVISLLEHELDPSEVCKELKLCDQIKVTAIREDILNCAVCETVVVAVKKVISNDKVDRDIVHIVEKSCGLLPAKYSQRCHTLMEIYGDSVIHLVEQFGTKAVCQKIGLCGDSHGAYAHMHKR